MRAIISEGRLIALCEEPRYVKLNTESGAYVQTTEKDAEGIAVSGEVYNLPGGTAIPERPEALIDERDAAEYVFGNRVRIEENEAAIVDAEDALCETNAETDARLTEVEDALCELDAAINNG